MARSLVAVICLVTLPRVLAGQADTAGADSSAIGARFTFSEPAFGLREPEMLRAPWMGAPRPPPTLRAMSWDSTVSAALDSARSERAAALRALTLYGRPAPEEQTGDRAVAPPGRGLLGLSRKYADVAVDGQVRLELRTDRLRNERCGPALLLDPNSGCRGGFKAPRLDNQVNVRSSGIIGQRIHLAVDYDTERDFSANNNIQVYYQGLEDEIIRRIEVGTVTFQPPQSRFITAAIPANNFGVNARFEVGPFQFQTLAATQKGSQVAERVYTVGQTTSQPQDRQLRDLDFETGRFYWVVDPTTALPGYPAIDILNLPPGVVAPAEQPAQVRVYRYTPPQNQTGGADPNLGGITALARTIDPGQSFGPVRWQLLIQGADYYLDPSGLWFALATKLDQNDYLAVSYTTAAGTTVGSFPAEDQGQGSTDSLRLVVEPKKGPEAVTFRHEMRQIYRASGADLDRGSLQVNLSVNRSERPLGEASTYLALLGLATATDQNVFDRENRLFPRTRDPDAAEVLRESYIVFPTVTPFADPRLSPAERSDSLYRTPLYLLLAQGPAARFQVRLRYNSTGAGDRSTLSLGGIQIRDGSEQLLLGGRRLERGVDYTISYDLGQVTFLNPDALFGSSAGQITARFEEQGLFAVAPTTILGLATSYSLGEVGAINLIGMYQREQSAFNRPPLGFEASANLIGGINTALRFRPSAVSRFLSGLTTRPAVAPSLLDVNAEFAFTKPDQNRSGQAYVEEFEAEAGVPLSLQETAWEFGSVPQQADGVEDIGFAGGFQPDDAVALTWQNLIPVPGSNQPVELRPQDIDSLIRTSGRTEQLETALYFTLHADTAGGVVQRNNDSRWTLPERPSRPRWRSMVSSLSPTGLDLTRDEYLEFWVFQSGERTAESAGVRLVLDLGTVNEDALAVAPDTIFANGSDTLYTGRQYVGQGRLDTERNSFDIFDAQVDDIGILGDLPDVLTNGATGAPVGDLPLCERVLSTAVPVFPWGDLSGRCTRGNGALDTEDLNGDNVLNASGPLETFFRYVVSLAPGDKYFVRNGQQVQDNQGRISGWQLYRIPIRTPDATIGTPNLRLIQHLRVTVAAPPDPGLPDVVAQFGLARLRLVGSPWVRRAESPIAGISGSLGEPTGEVIVSVISTENRTDLGYESPPGVFEGVSRRGGDRGALGTQINEKSLRLIARGLELNERAEAYLRFPAGPQNVLGYRAMRVWMRGRGVGWDEGDLQAFIKLGSDDRNFYLYRAPARSTTWEPEFVVDLEVWRRLRADLESRWLSGAPPSGAAECGAGDPTAFVACEGPYLVHLADPGINPPNLAAVQEVSAGIYRVAGAAPEAELWVDDIRLGNPVSDVGTALALDTRLVASDVGGVTASYVRRDGQFHQINSSPTYRTTGTFQLATSWRLDRFLPPSLGLSVPLSVTYNRSDVNPTLITGTDIRGEALDGLRTPQSWTANYNLAIRRSQRGTGWLVRGLVDPLSVAGVFTQGRSRTELSDAHSDAYSVVLGYSIQLQRRGPKLPFGGLIKRLPKWIRESEGGKSLGNATFSLIPSNVRWSSGLSRNQADYSLFAVPVTRPDDALIRPTVSLTHLWSNSGGLTWQPLGMLSLNGDLTSTRDLRVYPDSTSLGRLAYAERRFFLGVPVGVERDRTLTTALAVTPRLSSWLRPRFTTSSNFLLSRTLTSRAPVQADEDTGAFILPQTLNNSRVRDIGLSVDLSRALRQLWGDSSGVGKAVARVRPFDISTKLSRSSTFDLNVFDPSLGFMLGLGGLDDFLSQAGESARGATESRTATLASGADLPFGITATFSYSLIRTDRFQQVADGFSATSSRQREWPVGNLRWTRTFAGGPLTVATLGAGIRRREGTSSQAGGAREGARSATSSSSVTPDLQLTFRNGLGLTAAYSTRSQRSENNGNANLLDQDDITGSLSYAFALPAAISRTRKRVRSTLTAVSSKTLTCLEQGGNPLCTVVSDVRRQEVRGGLDTDLLKTVSGGFQFGYSINDARHLSRRTSQIFLLLSMQLSLYAGDYR